MIEYLFIPNIYYNTLFLRSIQTSIENKQFDIVVFKYITPERQTQLYTVFDLNQIINN